MSGRFAKLSDFMHAFSYYVSLFRVTDVAIEEYLEKNLRTAAKYQDPKRLGRYEFQTFSQSGADGIIAEIFRRVGRTNSAFVEFGVGDGLENNTTALLLQGWSGVWLDGSKKNFAQIQANLRVLIEAGKLVVAERFITRDNIVGHLEACDVPDEPDLMSIDIDGNDYWVWESLLDHYAPRVVVIEYNALLGPSVSWTIAYNATHGRRSLIPSMHYGASLKALEILGRRHGYSLVGCDFMGINAFFVRDDLVADRFCAPFTAENHFEPERMFLYRRNGHRRAVGPFVNPSDVGDPRRHFLTREIPLKPARELVDS